MKNMKNMQALKMVKSLGGATALLLSFAVNSQATLITQNGPSVTPASGATVPAAGLLLDTLVSSFTATANGFVQSGVLTSSVYNTVGGLTFVYTVTETGTTVNTQLALDGYADASLNIGYTQPLGTVAPTSASLAASVLNWAFNPAISTPQSSATLVVVTTDTTYGENGASAQDGTVANANDLAPVPEPSTVIAGLLVLLPSGASTLQILRKKLKV
jgi:hypothetical protein